MTTLVRSTCSILAWLAFLAPLAGHAHHSTLGFFDPDNKVEIQGVLTDVTWRNPHTVFELDVVNARGETEQWHVESGALGVLRMQGLTDDILKVGDPVRILGDSSMRGRLEMFARNILLASGEEVMLTLGASPYFSTRENIALRAGSFDEQAIARARAEADGIFRVWSRVEADLSLGGLSGVFSIRTLDELPYTARGQQVREAWNPSAEFILGCTDWQMPRLMNNPLPIEFVRQGEDILLRFEEDDNARLIHMTAVAPPVDQAASSMGWSAGRWQGETLIIETSRLLASDYELPVSTEATLLERFTPSTDGKRLDYEITLTDPVMLTAPVTQVSAWTWRPEITVNRYACEEEQGINP